MTDYSMNRRTYRYFTGVPLYPFGYGLSYSTFVYSKLYFLTKIQAGAPNVVQVRLFNSGPFDGDEVRVRGCRVANCLQYYNMMS